MIHARVVFGALGLTVLVLLAGIAKGNTTADLEAVITAI